MVCPRKPHFRIRERSVGTIPTIPHLAGNVRIINLKSSIIRPKNRILDNDAVDSRPVPCAFSFNCLKRKLFVSFCCQTVRPTSAGHPVLRVNAANSGPTRRGSGDLWGKVGDTGDMRRIGDEIRGREAIDPEDYESTQERITGAFRDNGPFDRRYYRGDPGGFVREDRRARCTCARPGR